MRGPRLTSIGPQGMGGVVALWGAPSLVKSVQRGTIALAATASNTGTITPVDAVNTVVTLLGMRDSGLNNVNSATYQVGLTLTNATTITATLNTAAAGTILVNYQVTEYMPGVLKSVQRGTLLATGGTTTVVLPVQVDPAKAQIVWMGMTTADVSSDAINLPTLALNAAGTQLVMTCTSVGSPPTSYWQVVEWYEMADASYIKSLVGALSAEIKLALDQAFTYVLSNLRFGAVEHQTRATNFQAYWLTGNTAPIANQEFTIAHGLGHAPAVLFPVLPLDQIGAQIVPLTVTRASDNSRIYLRSPIASAFIAVLVE